MVDPNTALAQRSQNGASPGLVLRDDAAPGLALSFAAMRARVEALNEFYQGVMQKGTDYDVLPGTPKPTLLQPGAQLLDGIFGLAPTFEELGTSARDYERGFFAFDVRCRLISKANGETVAEGIGHCNSKEDKYRWRVSKRVCPTCGAEEIIKGKAEFGGGWLCFARKGGCGAKFKNDDAAIVTQTEGRVENDDPYTLVNTILKMAEKRAHVAATLNATGASRIFTQDVEDLPEFQRGAPVPATEPETPPARQQAPSRKAPPEVDAAVTPREPAAWEGIVDELETDAVREAGLRTASEPLRLKCVALYDEIKTAVPSSTLKLPLDDTEFSWQAWLERTEKRWAASEHNPKNAKKE